MRTPELCLLGLLASSLGSLAGCDNEEGPRPCPDTPGVICTWAGTGAPGFNGDDLSLVESRFYWPADVTFTSTGTYILDWNNHRVRRVQEDGTLETVIGTDFVGDGPPDKSDLTQPGAEGTTIDLNHPTQVLDMPDGRLILVSWHNHKLRIWDPDTGLAYVACGTGAGPVTEGMTSEPLAMAKLNQPAAGRFGPDGMLYILDQRNQVIRRIDTLDETGTIEVVVGTPGMFGFAGDGGSPLAAMVHFPKGSNPPPAGTLDFDTAGRLYFADTLNNRIRRVDFAADTIETVVGDGGTEALNNPRDVEAGPDGRIYVADEFNNRVLALDPESLEVEVVAGTGEAGFSGDYGPANEAQLNRPFGLAFDEAGDLYISDTYNHRIRIVRGAN
jgi:sugar lactone lactonase YvrE